MEKEPTKHRIFYDNKEQRRLAAFVFYICSFIAQFLINSKIVQGTLHLEG